MIYINKCKDIAKNLALQSKEKLGEEKLNEFFNDLNKFIAEYGDKYMLYSTAIRLEKLESFNNWVPEIIKNKDILTPIIVDKMVNEKDLYSLSLYQNFHAGTNLILDIEGEYKSECYENGGGENALALITGCNWIEQKEASELVE